MNKDIERVRTLLDSGTDLRLNQPDNYHLLPLERAIASDAHELVQLLLDHGATANQPCMRGDTPLHQAAHCGNPVCVQLLLDHGADVHKKNADGRIPLYYAVVYDKQEAAQIIREHMARIEMYAFLRARQRLEQYSPTSEGDKLIARNIFEQLLLCLQQEFAFDRAKHQLEIDIFKAICTKS